MKASTVASIILLSAAIACDRSAPEPGTARAADAGNAAAASPGAQTATATPTGTPTTTARVSQQVTVTRPTSSPATTQASGQDATHAKLYGTWVARDVDASMGDVKIRLTFRQDGPVRIMAWSELPLVGQVRNKQAPYEVNGNTISSDALRGGTSVKYRFDGGDLLIEYKEGKTVRFTRES